MFDRKAVIENNLRYKVPLAITLDKLRYIGIKPETDIFIYPDYPFGWHSVVGANNRVYVFNCRWGRIRLEIEQCHGFRPNGTLIRKK